MAGKPFRSILIPYLDEIAELRSQRPPVSYARIAEILREKHGLNVKRAAIGKFVKLRSGGRKVYFFRRDVAARRSQSVGATPAQRSKSCSQVRVTANAQPKANNDDDFGFTYSDHYTLTRLPPEEAAARRKKLEEEGH